MSMKGHIVSQSTRDKISAKLKGRPSWNKGKHHSEDTKKKIALAHTKYSEELISQLLKVIEIGSTLKNAFEVVNISDNTFYVWCEQHPDLKEKVNIARGIAKAEVVQALKLSIKRGNVDAIKFWLKNRGKDEWNDTTNINAIVGSNSSVISEDVKSIIENIDNRNEVEKEKIIDAIRKLSDK